MIPPADAASIVASGLKPSVGIIGATIDADVMTPTVVDPVIINRRPGRIETRSLSIAYKSFDELEDLYALQYVVDARVRSSESMAQG